ncbi:MAG: dNTP triphosphohydrolase [Bacteroidetes bacterium]|nr:dNTP triphosphohydrolase [Bacteroidota bacterium]
MNWLQLLSYQRPGAKTTKDISPDQLRSEFEKDFDRIIFSHPFRKLQDKTQVIPLPKQDFVHTRLTHSLEVSSVGRSLGKKVGEVILQRHPKLAGHHLSQFDFGAIVAAACLAHDLGNPPFGHSGEAAISDFFVNHPGGLFFKDKVGPAQWADLSNFEGNAQGFRILNHAHFQGLKLTYATLATFTKYPRESLLANIDPNRKSQKKYGFFQTEKEKFTGVADNVGLIRLGKEKELKWCRHPLTFLVEAADDICYHIIDLEDGCRLGWVDFATAKELLAGIIGSRYDPSKLKKIASENEKIGVLRAIAIDQLIRQSAQVFLDSESSILDGSFDSALIESIPARQSLYQIIKLSIRNIYRSKTVIETEAIGFQVLNGLLEEITSSLYYYIFERAKCTKKQENLARSLPLEIQDKLNDERGIYGILRNGLDFVSGMTDSNCLQQYRRIKGIALPGMG